MYVGINISCRMYTSTRISRAATCGKQELNYPFTKRFVCSTSYATITNYSLCMYMYYMYTGMPCLTGP